MFICLSDSQKQTQANKYMMQRNANLCELCSGTCSSVFFSGLTAVGWTMFWSTSSPDICLSQLSLNSSLAWISLPVFSSLSTARRSRCLLVRITALGGLTAEVWLILCKLYFTFHPRVTVPTLCSGSLPFYQLEIKNNLWLWDIWTLSPLTWEFSFLCWRDLKLEKHSSSSSTSISHSELC